MSKVYKNYDQKFVATNFVYTKATDSYAYVDAAGTTQMDGPTLKEMFHLGATIVTAAGQFVPVSLVEAAGNKVTLTYVVADGTTATTAVLTLLKSKEHAAG